MDIKDFLDDKTRIELSKLYIDRMNLIRNNETFSREEAIRLLDLQRFMCAAKLLDLTIKGVAIFDTEDSFENTIDEITKTRLILNYDTEDDNVEE